MYTIAFLRGARGQYYSAFGLSVEISPRVETRGGASLQSLPVNRSAYPSSIGLGGIKYYPKSMYFYCFEHLAGVVPKPLALDAWEMRVTFPLPSNTQPVAGTISTASAFDGGLAALASERCCCVVVAEVRVSDQMTSVLRGS